MQSDVFNLCRRTDDPGITERTIMATASVKFLLTMNITEVVASKTKQAIQYSSETL
jgi:hypothetical protein